MDSMLKKRWVEALRSGKYEQGTNALRTRRDEFCCLGVLCDLVHPEKWKSWPADNWSMDGNGLMPTEEIREGVGLAGEYATRLSELNDEGKSFEEIADYIESVL